VHDRSQYSPSVPPPNVAQLWWRRFESYVSSTPGRGYDQEETYFLVRVSGEPTTDGRWTDVEEATIVGHRWWTIEELRRTDETVYREGLADILERFL
jgi:hypothetical protein